MTARPVQWSTLFFIFSLTRLGEKLLTGLVLFLSDSSSVSSLSSDESEQPSVEGRRVRHRDTEQAGQSDGGK